MKTNHLAAIAFFACIFISSLSFGQTTFCVGDVANLSISRNIGCGAGQGFDVVWDGASGGSITNQVSGSSNFTVTWTTAGTFRIKRNFPSGCSGTPLYSPYYTVSASPSTPPSGELNQQPGTCGQATVNYTGASSGYWQTCSGCTDETYQTSRTVTSTGTYYLRTKNASGCWSPAQSITVSSLPASPVGGSLSGGGTFYGSVSTNLNLSGQSGSIIEYRYTENGGGVNVISNTSSTLSINISTSGTQINRQYWAVIELNGCQVNSGVANVTVNSLPAVSRTACVGQTTDHSIPRNIGCGYGLGYNATFVNGIGGSINDPGGSSSSFTVTWTTPGIYTLQRTFPSQCNTTLIIETIQVYATPASPSVSEVNQQPGICGQVALNYTGSGNGFWQANSYETYETYPTTRIVTATQDYHLKVKSSDGCWSAPRTLTVSSLPPGPTGGTLYSSFTSIGSANATLSLAAHNGSIKEYRYSENGGSDVVVTQTSSTLPISISNPTSATITRAYRAIVQLNGCETSSTTATISINPLTTPTASVTADYTSICGSTVITQSNPLSGTEQYEWWWQTASDGTSTTLGKNSSVTITSSGPLYLRARTKNAPLTWGPTLQSLGTYQVYTMPAAPSSGTSASSFYNNSVTLSVGAVASATTYRWYDSQSAGNLVTTTATNAYTISNLLSTTPLFVAAVSGGCETAARFPVTATLVVPHIVSQSGSPNIIMGAPVILGVDGVYNSYAWKDSNGITQGTQSTFSTTQADKYTVTVTKSGWNGSGISGEFKVGTGVNGQDLNFVVANSILVAGVTSSEVVDGLAVESNNQTIQYFDGLGRPMQSVTTQGSPGKKDIVQPVVYDNFGREARKYLPVAPGGADGWFKIINYDASGNYTGTAGNFYSNNTNGKIAQDTRPFSETIFENSPLSRPVKSYGPGQAWSSTIGSDKFIGHEYLVNIHGTAVSATAEKIIAWKVDPSTGMPVRQSVTSGYIESTGHFSTGQLLVAQTKDEQGNAVREYTNKSGQVILKKVQAATAGSTDLNNTTYWALTYYIYDDLGNLRYVFQPELSKLLHGNADTYVVTTTDLNNWAFQYKYDLTKRMTEKQVPGASVVYMVYDKRDRLVLTQDGNQRASTPKYWSFTKYDDLNRPILTGIKDTSVLLTQPQMQDVVDTYYSLMSTTKPWRKYGEKYVGAVANNVHGYTNFSYPQVTTVATLDSYNYLTVTYYDNYGFRSLWLDAYTYVDENLSETVNGVTYYEPHNESLQTIGQVTGTKVKVLDGGVTGGNNWLKTANYYDDKLRLIQTVTDHQRKGIQRVTSLLDFSGKILAKKSYTQERSVQWKDLVNANSVGTEIRKSVSTYAGDGGAASVQVLPASQDGWVEMIYPGPSGASEQFFGFNDSNPDTSPSNMDYAFLITANNAAGNIRVYENGVLKAAMWGMKVKGDVLRIERVGTQVYYKSNGVTEYISSLPSNTQLMVDACILTGGGFTHNTRASFGDIVNVVTNRYTYDHAGRLINTWHKVDEPIRWQNVVGVMAGNSNTSLTKTLASYGWDAGASTPIIIAQGKDGWVECQPSVINPVFGLAYSDANTSYTSIDYAIYFEAGNQVNIYEAGVFKGRLATFTSTDVFRIERISGTVYYKKNGVVFYTSTTPSTGPLLVDTSFHYPTGKLSNIRVSPSQPEILLVKNEYNELGQLIDKKLHSTVASGANAKQSVDYRYNIRGWLTKLNESDLSGGDSGDARDFFGMELGYNNDIGVSNTGLFNGNISATKWSANLALGAVKENASLYSYDALNRITGSSFKEKSTSWNSPANNAFAETGFTYDLNGNILTLQRNDRRTTGWMDNLSYNYGSGATASNKLISVTDTGDDYAGFLDGNPGSDADYTYDLNGNMTRDLNKGIGHTTSETLNIITYNHLNLPQTVTKGANTIRYVYDATGRKLSQVTSFGGQLKQTDYLGEFVYENNNLQFINHEEGRIVVESNQLVYSNSGDALTDFTAANSTLAVELKTNGQKYVRVTSNGTTPQTGIFPIGGTFSVNPGERYRVRAKGYRTSNSYVYLLIKANGVEIAWPGASLASSLVSEAWMEQTITIPAGATTLQAGVAWNTVYNGEQFYLNDFEIVKLTTNTVPEYQYNLKDHLGNVRLTFTTKAEKELAKATMEIGNAATEQSQFIYYNEAVKINSLLFDHTHTTAAPVNMVKYSNDFSSNYTPFNVDGSQSLSLNSGRLKVGGATSWNNAYFALSTVAGSLYKVSFDIDLASGGSIDAFTNDPVTHQNLASLNVSSNGSYSYQFVATGATTTVLFSNPAAGPRDYYLDNVVIENLGGSYSTRLKGGPNEKYGLAKSLSVMPGDTLNIEVFAKYLDPTSTNWTTALGNLINSINNGIAPAGTFIDGGAAGSIGSQTFPYIGTLARSNDNGTGPKGYLNYILFDRNFVYKTGGFQRISSSPKETGNDVAHERLAFDNLVITEPGYIYIYLSNENETPVEVYFDDFKVEHKKSPVIQTDDYYPFGLTFNSYQRESSMVNNYLYNGKEKQDELDLGWLDYGFRMYEPTIGRWIAMDALTEKHKALSPYNYVLNNPLLFIDPLGLDTLKTVTITASRIGSEDWQSFMQAIGYDGYRNFVETLYQSKLDPYRSEFSAKIYGRDAQGEVDIPDAIEEREREEAEEEALPLLATLWAMEQSGEDPGSIMYLFNPLAQANFLNSYVQTGISTEEGKKLVTNTGIQVGLAWLGSISIKSPNQILTNKTKSNGGGITLFQVKNGKKFRIDYDRVNKVHYHRRGTGTGQGIGRHRPWQKKATDKSFWDRF